MNPLPATDPTLAVVLRRVSSAEQADAYGLAAQQRACRAFAAAQGLTIVGDFAEDARSTTLLSEREAGRAALDAMLRHGAGVLLLARRDRLARDTYVAGDAKRAVALMGGRILYAEGGNGDRPVHGRHRPRCQRPRAAGDRCSASARARRKSSPGTRSRERKAARCPTATVGRLRGS